MPGDVALRSIASRFSFTERPEPFRLRAEPPHVHGYTWRRSEPTASLVLIHGFQSHAQWFAEAGELLYDRGFSVYALDRRGSGSSPEERGHVDRYQDWLEEVGEVAARAREEAPVAPVHLIGHCFGANLAMGAVLTQPIEVASIVMLTPGLYVEPDYTLRKKAQIAFRVLTRSHALFRAPQEAAMFSRDPDLIAWIRADTLGAQRVTGPCLLQAGRLLRFVRRGARQLSVPVLVLEAEHDRISDNARNRATLGKALGERCRWITFDAEHFLLAEPCRDDVIAAIADWVEGRSKA
jgi:alpha-beta hydrolase superfamily lysophospholipase